MPGGWKGFERGPTGRIDRTSAAVGVPAAFTLPLFAMVVSQDAQDTQDDYFVDRGHVAFRMGVIRPMNVSVISGLCGWHLNDRRLQGPSVNGLQHALRYISGRSTPSSIS